MGRPKAKVWGPKALRPIWQHARATDVIINGDVAEVHDPIHRALAAKQVLELQTLCEEDGVRLTLLSGNHDPHLTDLRHLSLYQGEVFLTHGDMLHPAISPWNDYAPHLRALRTHALACLDEGDKPTMYAHAHAAQHASHVKWDEFAAHDMPKVTRAEKWLNKMLEVPRVFWYWHRLPRTASDFAAEYVPRARFFIFGHIHRAGIWEMAGRTIINTGSFDFPHQPRAVIIKRDQLSVWKLERRGMSYHLAGMPMRKWDLNNVQVMPVGDGLHAA